MTIATPFTHTVDLQCPNCEATFTATVIFTEDSLEYVATDERPMGAEYQYEANLEITCPDCEHTLDQEFNVWEYPEGTINLIEP